MNEDLLRALVRETLARLDAASDAPSPTPFAVSQPLPLAQHASHYRYSTLPRTDGPCLIEPSVQCNHCGYCESHGH
jgi:hypothetical protein